MRFPSAKKVQVWPVDKEEFLLPRGFHNDRKDKEPDLDEKLFEVIEDALDRFDDFGTGSALPAVESFGGV